MQYADAVDAVCGVGFVAVGADAVTCPDTPLFLSTVCGRTHWLGLAMGVGSLVWL